MRVIGTAGHVDHGKSRLVEALTGIDPDRLKEEKEREMTIDLGFAWLTLPSGEPVGVVDVPGHRDFIENMLAGVGGIDAALFVVAADEGVMPQTREHLAILHLLGVTNGVVALTKMDLIEDEEWLELVQLDVTELLEDTVLADASMVPVSVRTGQGLQDLLEKLDELLENVPPRKNLGRPRLPVDRVFTIAGFGTVVTGTLLDGDLQVGQEVEVLPHGLKARVRGLQTHQEKIERAVLGSRVAVNLTGVSKDEVQRGDVVTIPSWLKPTMLVDVRLRYLTSAPRPLRHNAPLKFFSGSAEVMARARLLDSEAIPPGGEGWVQLRLVEPVALVRGDRFIVRQPSPGVTVGGGQVIDPHPARRHRRFRSEVIARLATLARGSPAEILLQSLETSQPCQLRTLIERSGLAKEDAGHALQELLDGQQVLVLDSRIEKVPKTQYLVANNPYLISALGWEKLLSKLIIALRDYHQRHPLRQGMPREELKSQLKLSTKLLNEVASRAVSEDRLMDEEATLRLPEHQVEFSPDQEGQVRRLLAAFKKNPYTTPSVTDSEVMVGAEVLSALIQQGKLVQISEDVLFLKETYEEMVKQVIEHIKDKGSITVAQVRDMFAASRKYALSLMEHLDERRVTRRVGDERVLR
ncbi:MAG: selenocysteine-specific translation elongation factor [Anaerolineales bacterium]|nr:selenocysteine-specific translation elongation factor [Anaerolineales bacterium]